MAYGKNAPSCEPLTQVNHIGKHPVKGVKYAVYATV